MLKILTTMLLFGGLLLLGDGCGYDAKKSAMASRPSLFLAAPTPATPSAPTSPAASSPTTAPTTVATAVSPAASPAVGVAPSPPSAPSQLQPPANSPAASVASSSPSPVVTAASSAVMPSPSVQEQLAAELKQMTTDGLQQYLDNRQAQDRSEIIEQQTLQILNQQLCQKLRQVRNECRASTRIIADGSSAALICNTDEQAQALQNLKNGVTTNWDTPMVLKVSLITSSSKKFILVIDGIYNSTPFGNGTSVITFQDTTNSQATPPRFYDVQKFEAVPADTGGTMPKPEDFVLNLQGDTELLLSYQDLIPPTDLTNILSYVFSPQRLLTLRSSPVCQVNQGDIATMKQRIAALVEANYTEDAVDTAQQAQQGASKATKTSSKGVSP